MFRSQRAVLCLLCLLLIPGRITLTRKTARTRRNTWTREVASRAISVAYRASAWLVSNVLLEISCGMARCCLCCPYRRFSPKNNKGWTKVSGSGPFLIVLLRSQKKALTLRTMLQRSTQKSQNYVPLMTEGTLTRIGLEMIGHKQKLTIATLLTRLSFKGYRTLPMKGLLSNLHTTCLCVRTFHVHECRCVKSPT